ncbi:MAG: TlpA family protein disulfide reductase [Pyrinomonadaceae bacterium]
MNRKIILAACLACLREILCKINLMKAFYFALFIFCFLIFSACRPAAAPVSISNQPVSINNIPQTNLPLPPTTNIENLGWKTLAGENVKLSDLKGKIVVLDFWATYCPPCLEEIPHLVGLQNKYANLQIVGLHVGGDEDAPNIPAFKEKLKINYPLAFPQDALTYALLGNNDAIPQTIIFDKNGRAIKRFVGFDEIIKTEIDDAIKQATNQ